LEITLPADCGNAPRVEIVGNFTVHWAEGNAAGVAEWLTDTSSWTLVGQETFHGFDASTKFPIPFTPRRLVVEAIITHGRLASCDGYVEGDGARIDFSHAFRFASAVKTARIAELRSYCIETRPRAS